MVQEPILYLKRKADPVYPDRPFLCASNMFNSVEVEVLFTQLPPTGTYRWHFRRSQEEILVWKKLAAFNRRQGTRRRNRLSRPTPHSGPLGFAQR